jgi:hypothetical protein
VVEEHGVLADGIEDRHRLAADLHLSLDDRIEGEDLRAFIGSLGEAA